MNAKIEKTLSDILKAKALAWAIDEALSKIYPDHGQILMLERATELNIILSEKLDEIELGVEELQKSA